MSREAMQMALHTLEGWANYGNWVWPESALEQAKRNTTDSIAALRQALETEQEPVAWISDSPTKGNGKQLHWTKSEAWRWSSNITPLYTAPPKRKPLTDSQILEIAIITKGRGDIEFVRAIEAAHGITSPDHKLTSK